MRVYGPCLFLRERANMPGYRFAALALLGAVLAGCQADLVESPPVVPVMMPSTPVPPKFVQVGFASWYGPELAGKFMADGGHFDVNGLTAAHRTLPLHSSVRVTNLDNGRSTVVQITDRGPFLRGRIIDLSEKAASNLRMKEEGVARVRVEALDQAAGY